MQKKWRKLGRIITADPTVAWMSHCAGPTYVEQLGEERIRIYMSGRDADNVSRIGTVDLSTRDMQSIVSVSKEPLLDVGDVGCFDERGVAYPWLVRHGGRTIMYYVGWVAGGLGGFSNALGAAALDEKSGCFTRLSRAPVCDRTSAEPIGVGSACVLEEAEGGLRMWYTSFDRWSKLGSRYRHYYCIKTATSSDGINWRREDVRCIDYETSNEYAIGKPCVVKDGGRYRMWYSFRGEAYRIGFAESCDGVKWTRKDVLVGIAPSETGWDSESVEYAHVFHFNGTWFMLYNGNGYGRTGVGMSVLE
jgi:hypothetical protein